MEDLAVFTALNHSGPFGENFVTLKKKLKKKNIYIYMLFTGKGSVCMVKNYTEVTVFHHTDRLLVGK